MIGRSDGERGGQLGEFNQPRGLYFDHQKQRLIVADWANEKVQFCRKIKSSADQSSPSFVGEWSFGSEGKRPLQFSGPTGVCLQPGTNHLIVCEMFNQRIQVLALPEQDSQQDGPTEQPQPQPQPQFLYCIQLSEILDQNSDSITTSICCNARGDMFVADAGHHQVHMFDCQGRYCTSLESPDRLKNPSNVFVNLRQSQPLWRSILVADTSKRRIVIWDGSSSVAPKFVTYFPIDSKPLAVCVDLNGLVVVGTEANKVQIYDPRMNFALLQTFGGHPRSVKWGCFNDPTGLCVDDENLLYVSDNSNNRIQVFNTNK